MKRRWNWPIYAGFVITLVAFLSYFMVFARFPITRDVPWASLLLFALGFVLLGTGIVRAFRQPAEYRGRVSGSVLGVLSVLVLGLFVFYNFWFSKQLPASRGAPVVGAKAPDFTLPDMNGTPLTLSQLWASAAPAQREQWVLLVFYRGYW